MQPPAPFYYSDQFQGYDMGPNHPLKPMRLKMTYELLRSYGLFSNTLELREPQAATLEEVLKTHSADYLEALRRLDSGERPKNLRQYGFGTGDNPIFSEMYSSSMLYTGASIEAAQAVNNGAPLAFNISGGLHHAHYASAAGFCILNDCAAGIRRLRERFERVAYIDIDVHHGDGVQELFYDDPSVLTVSIHESGRTLFPGTGFVEEQGEGEGQGASVNVPLAPYTTDTVWISAWREGALEAIKRFNPDAIFLQMGTDAHYLDPLGHVALTAAGWLTAVQDVKALGKPIVAVGGGGYNRTCVPRMWCLSVGILTNCNLNDDVPQSYAYRNEILALHDSDEPLVSAAQTRASQLYVEDAIEKLRTSHPLFLH